MNYLALLHHFRNKIHLYKGYDNNWHWWYRQVSFQYGQVDFESHWMDTIEVLSGRWVPSHHVHFMCPSRGTTVITFEFAQKKNGFGGIGKHNYGFDDEYRAVVYISCPSSGVLQLLPLNLLKKKNSFGGIGKHNY